MSAPDLSTLPQRMRYAATVLREVHARTGMPQVTSWDDRLLVIRAEAWEAEDAEIEQLAEEIRAADVETSTGKVSDSRMRLKSCKDIYIPVARQLIKSGWRKGDSA